MASSQISTSTFENTQECEASVLSSKLLKPLDDVLKCSICFEYFTNCMITKCSHNYCSVCIRRYMNYKSQCPTCFQVATEPELQNNRLIDEILRIYMKIRENLHVPLENVNISFPEQSTSFKPLINKSISKPEKAGSSNNNNNSDQQNEGDTSDEVSCPVCYTAVPSSRINIHLDLCLKQSEERSQRKFLPKLVYHLMTDKEIKKKLKEHGLSTSGVRQKTDEKNKSTDDEWTRKRELANARMRRYRKRKQIASKQSMAQDESMTDEMKKLREKQIEEEKTQRRKELARERSRIYRRRKRINALKTADHLINDSQIPEPSDDNPPFESRFQSTTFHDSQIAGTSTNMDFPLILDDNDSENTLIRRHKNFITLYNANNDSLNPKPVSDLLLEIERLELEERLNAMQRSTQTDKKSDPSDIEKEHESYLEEHRSQFTALIQDVQQRALDEMNIKKEIDNTEVSTSNITDESGNVIGETIFTVRNTPVLEPVTVKSEPTESLLEDEPVIIKEEPPDSVYEDPNMMYNEEQCLDLNSAICDNEPETGMEYMDTGCKKSSRLQFRFKKVLPVVKIEEEPQFLLDPIPNQGYKSDNPSSLDDIETSKTLSNIYHKKKYARKLSTEEKNCQRKK